VKKTHKIATISILRQKRTDFITDSKLRIRNKSFRRMNARTKT
jgi:hypothetical protein